MPAMTSAQPLQTNPHLRPPAVQVVIENTEATAICPEGVTAKMPLESLFKQVAGNRLTTGDFILPDGVKAVIPRGPLTVCVLECPPGLHSLTWIAEDSPVGYGSGIRYRQMRLALPYLIILAAFEIDGSGPLQISPQIGCFFRNAPLKSLDEELCYPALLNCYGRGPGGPHSFSWVCTAGLRASSKICSAPVGERLCASLEVVRQYVLETGFNHSDGQGGRASWFEASRTLDRRLNTVEAWRDASALDPLFVLDVPWIKSGYSVRQAVERISPASRRGSPPQPTAATLARFILNHRAGTPPVPSKPAI